MEADRDLEHGALDPFLIVDIVESRTCEEGWEE
jgi:hypothetical protein